MARRLVQVCLGLFLGLAIAEAVFWLRDDGAFPHLNIYREDAELGVRLVPGASERIRFGGNPVSSVRINAQGYRGADWPAQPEIAVVGDSQVFGLGVEEDQTFSARLASVTGRSVANAGVPTFGPSEMLAITRELVAQQHPKVVIFTINLANDLFELQRPNRDRHRVWDGWAVRIETAPKSLTWFPGRDLIMRKSHLVYAGRRWLHEATEKSLGALPSEGTWKDLEALRPASESATAATIVKDTNQELSELGYVVEGLDGQLVGWATGAGDDRKTVEGKLVAAHGNTGDIVGRALPMESSRPSTFTAYHLYRAGHSALDSGEVTRVTPEMMRQAVEYRVALERRVAAAAKKPEELAKAEAALADGMTRLAGLRRASLADPHAASPLDATLSELAAICAPPACAPVVVVLPLDLQVAPEEWRKYGLEPQDMSVVGALTSSVIASAQSFGMRAVDVLPALKAAEPGAFLQHDIHMTSKGHAAVADAIAAALNEPAPRPVATGALPPGRTRVPFAFELRQTPEAIVRGSGKAHCETVNLDEWLRVSCRGSDVRHITVLHGVGDSFVNAHREAMTLLTPIPNGTRFEADFVWAGRTQRLTASRDAAGVLDASFGPPSQTTTPVEPVSAGDAALCACFKTMNGASDCGDVYGSTRPECFAGVKTSDYLSCKSAIACAQGFPGSQPTCAEGMTIAGGTLQCMPLCNDATPCASGTCVAWPNTHVCLGGQ